MKLAKRVLTLGLSVALAASLAACGDTMQKDSQTYIQGKLDMYYKGQYNKDYLELIDLTEAEAEEQYLDWLEQEVDYFGYYFDIEHSTDAYLNEVSEFYKQVYAQSDYVVHEATKLSSGNYAVEVTVRPIDIMLQVTEDDMYAAVEEAFTEVVGDTDVEALSEEEAEALAEKMDQVYAEKMLDLLESHLGEIGYGDEKSMVFQLAKDSSGYYSMVEGDLQNFDTYVISY